MERRAHGGQPATTPIDILDRVLDKGIVIDAWVRVSLVGIDLITVEARIGADSIDTHLRYAEAVGITAPFARPALDGARGSDDRDDSDKSPDAARVASAANGRLRRP
jgi:gas vesicle structural protein